jgi:hypothetical protein
MKVRLFQNLYLHLDRLNLIYLLNLFLFPVMFLNLNRNFINKEFRGYLNNTFAIFALLG